MVMLVKRALLEALKTKALIPSAASKTHRKYQSGLVNPEFDSPVRQERLSELVQEQSSSYAGLEGGPSAKEALSQQYWQRPETESGTELELSGNDRQVVPFPELHPLAQLPPLYILAAGEDGLYIIDQHAAHERVLYEDFLAGQGPAQSQFLLGPLTLELDYREAALLTERILWFTEAGFIIEHFGGNTFLLRGVPANFPPGKEKTIFLELLDYFRENGTASSRNEFFNRLAASVACRNAVKSGEKLTLTAMEALLKSLSGKANPFTCPHGRPAVIKISYRDLATRFSR